VARSEPEWWYSSTPQWPAKLLRPVANVYGAVAQWRYARANPYRSQLPVICVGNFTAGGTGKTPMSLLIADLVEAGGGAPWFLSRGYGGRLDGQERVDSARHTAAVVGDEPLLLAARAPTVISRDRRLGAEFIARLAPANAVIIMDDGLQNPALAKDLTIAVVDGSRGFGNGLVIPAGPLRAPLPFQMRLADVIVINGASNTVSGDRARQQLADMPGASRIPQLSAHPVPRGNTEWLKSTKVVAYAGIANPERFFTLLETLGATVVERAAFGDHQSMSNEDAEHVLALAGKHRAQLVTTEKDFVRLSGLDRARAKLQAASKTLPITLHMPDEDRAALAARVAGVIAEQRTRRLG
jgi:tetraacyldisaccharide 4'-kinase